jgi:hypothetical protein
MRVLCVGVPTVPHRIKIEKQVKADQQTHDDTQQNMEDSTLTWRRYFSSSVFIFFLPSSSSSPPLPL